jgi:predicted acylesterase/phospholipase RssA
MSDHGARVLTRERKNQGPRLFSKDARSRDANETMAHPPQTAFVLSGGAGLGAVQAGMMRALFERGIAPDLIVGASVGALNGAFIACRPPRPLTS